MRVYLVIDSYGNVMDAYTSYEEAKIEADELGGTVESVIVHGELK